MLISDNRKYFYDPIIQSRSPVLVLVSHDLDSIAAVKIIRYIFECDHIRYTIVPIRTKTELLRSYQEHRNGFKYVLLINLGATIDIVDLLIPENDVKIFIADCHRPLNINNVFYEKDIYILCSISGLHNIEDEFDKIPKYDELFWDSDIEVEDDVDVRQLSLEQLRKRNEFKKFETKRCQLMSVYEETTYFSHSISMIFFDLAWKLGKDSNDLLWLVILSVMDKDNTFKLQSSLMKKEIAYLTESMLRLRNIRSDRGFIVPTSNERPSELVTTTNHLNINYERDLNLKLYREWSLYESLKHTMYTSCGFKVWRLKGHKRLHTFLAELGLPLNQCQQKYSSMDLCLRTKLLEDFEGKKDKYNLPKLIVYSFIGTRGIKQKFSAYDLSMATRALLESSDSNRSYNQKFFDAYDSLSWNHNDLIHTGIALAKIQLTAIVKQVQIIIDAHLITSINNVLWYVIIPESSPDANLFCHPGCLKSLTIYTLSAYASFAGKSKKSIGLPLVLIIPDPEKPGGGIVCGVSPLLAIKNCKTFFRQAFSTVSKKMFHLSEGWSHEESIIDPDIAYISYKDAHNFLNELSLLLESNLIKSK
ncbi:folylpolyglutamate synthase [Sarcoptes scabiei]|nr:folylpolyglutamate synthase [Sarcoptes scabiei]